MLSGNDPRKHMPMQQFLELEHNSQAKTLAESILALSTDPDLNEDFVRYYCIKIAHELFQKPMFEEKMGGGDTNETYEAIQYEYRVDVINRLQAMLP
jgi:hypothetical protein